MRQRHARACPRIEGGKGYRPHKCTGKWEYVLDVGDSSNSRIQEKKGGFATRDEASAARAARRGSLVGRPVDAHRLTVAQYLNAWLDGKANLRPSSRESYRDYIDRLLIPAIGGLRLVELERNPEHLERLFRDLTVRKNRHGRCMSAAALRRVHAVLRAALTKAVRKRYLTFNPVLTVELPGAGRPRTHVWTAEQACTFLDYLDGDPAANREPERLRALYHEALVTGMRRGELLGQRWAEDVDLDTRAATVAEQRVKTRAGVVVGKPKTKAVSGRSRSMRARSPYSLVTAASRKRNALRGAKRGRTPVSSSPTRTGRR